MLSESRSERVDLCSRQELATVLSSLRGKRVVLMGLGLCGGGEGAARFLVSRGARLLVTDRRGPERLAPTLARLEGLPIEYRLGGHIAEDLAGADLVVANPGVPRSSGYLRGARAAGVPVTSPMNVMLALCPASVVAVTGSNGKSTTTAMLADMLRQAGRRVWLGGNIGGSLLPSLAEMAPSDLVVLELSSFQLEDAAAIRWSPHVAVVTNITPNHLDRHGTYDAYVSAKRTIVAFQCPDDYAVMNARNAELRHWACDGLRGRVYLFNSEPHPGRMPRGTCLMGQQIVWRDDDENAVICARRDVPLLGSHNAENTMAAAAAARCLHVEVADIRDALVRFQGLEHRLELVGQAHALRFYNDSFSTTPDSTEAALGSFHGGITLIAGGYDKQLDVRHLARTVASRVAVLITMGQTGPDLARRVHEESLLLGRPVLIREAASLEDAVSQAGTCSMPGSAVVLSPGFASYDMFDNCIQRGVLFKDLVRTMFLSGHMRSGRP